MNYKKKWMLILLSIIVNILLTGFVANAASLSDHAQYGDHYVDRTPEAPGTIVYGNDIVSIDASNTNDGYIIAQYYGSVEKAKVRLTTPNDTVYTYVITDSSSVLPLNGGNGDYTVSVYENVTDNKYRLLFSQELTVSLMDDMDPFLRPNQRVWYDQDSKVVALGKEIAAESVDANDYIQKVYSYITNNFSYDEEKAESVQNGYIPDVDSILESKTGICIDFAALMTALLRSQSIPAKLEVGNVEEDYHAWVSVYFRDAGEVDKLHFDAEKWGLLDPTCGISNTAKAVKEFIGDRSRYQVKCSY